MNVIETSDLRKVYAETVAVDGLGLAVGRGEVFGFLGPNGAGKTTTVKMLLGLVRPTSGEARVLGYAPGDARAMVKVGFLPEHFNFHSWLTAAGLLEVHGKLYGMPPERRRQRIPQLLERVGLAGDADRRIAAFSKGMSQRIGLAQALLNEPELVFLDEPTSGLDPVGRSEVRDLIRELSREGVTVFLNSHLLSEVEVTCHRVAIIKKGKLVRIGTQEELTGSAVEVDLRAGGLTAELKVGLSRWARVIEDDGQRMTLAVEDEDRLPEIARWLTEGGARLFALSPRRLSLEELFMRAIREES